MIQVGITEWHTQLRAVTLNKGDYWMPIITGKSDDEALKAAIKEFKRLIKVCEGMVNAD